MPKLQTDFALVCVCATCVLASCSDGSARAVDAGLRSDARPLLIDAGPKTYERAEDFPRDGCDDNDSLENFAFLGKWHNVPQDGSDEFDSYFLMEERELKGILDLIPANRLLVDANNLFLQRRYNLTSLAVNLCAVIDDDALFGHMARCNGASCTLTTVEATLVAPMTEPMTE